MSICSLIQRGLVLLLLLLLLLHETNRPAPALWFIKPCRIPRDLSNLGEEYMADFLTADKLRELCVERSLPKQGNHGKLVAQLLHWKRNPNKLLEGWNEAALMGKYNRDEIVEMCDDRLIRSTGSKQTLLDRLMVWQRGPEADGTMDYLEGWSAEQLMARCTTD